MVPPAPIQGILRCARIVAVDELPYTRSGKKVEVALAGTLNGDPPHNRGAFANPQYLDRVADIPALFE